MGTSISRLSEAISGKKKIRISIVGLKAAGKTTILYKLKVGEVSSIPTIGFGVETIPHKDFVFTVFEVGGSDKIRALLRHYFEGIHGIIFVVDSSDKESIESAKHELHWMLGEEGLKDKPILVFANKQDLTGMSSAEVAEKLNLSSLRNREWYLQSSCAITGDGLYEGLDWLNMVVSKKK